MQANLMAKNPGLIFEVHLLCLFLQSCLKIEAEFVYLSLEKN